MHYPSDRLFQESFSIEKIDETIARSKRIVEESLAISANEIDNSMRGKQYSFSSSKEDDSIGLDFSQFQIKKTESLDFKNEFEPESRIRNFGFFKENLGLSLSENKKYLKELESKQFTRNKELFHLQNILQSQFDPNIENLEEALKQKKQKVKRLSEKITSHSIYKENQEIKAKLKHHEGKNVEKIIRSKILEEKKEKDLLESQYNALYQSHHEQLNDSKLKLNKITEQIKETEKAHHRTLNLLSATLEEKMLDNELLRNQLKPSPSKTSEPTYRNEKSIDYSLIRDKTPRKNSNGEAITTVSAYQKKIVFLEGQVKKIKRKYKQLKKLYLRKSRRTSSIEIRRPSCYPDQGKKKVQPKRKFSMEIHDKCLCCGKRHHTPGMTPY